MLITVLICHLFIGIWQMRTMSWRVGRISYEERNKRELLKSHNVDSVVCSYGVLDLDVQYAKMGKRRCFCGNGFHKGI